MLLSYSFLFYMHGKDSSRICLPESKENKNSSLGTCKTLNRWRKVICTRANMMWGSLTVIPDVPPAGDIAQHATWEQGARGGQADRTDIIWPGYWAGQLHQRQVLPAVRFDVSVRNHHPAHTMRWLVRVEAIQLVPASVDDVRAHVGRTEGGHGGDSEWKLLHWKYETFTYFILTKGISMAFCQVGAPSNGLEVPGKVNTKSPSCTRFGPVRLK